jgi:hypothetical protein
MVGEFPVSQNWALYSIADTFAIPIDPNGNLAKGAETRPVTFGPINMRFPMRLETDFVKGPATAAFVHLRGQLWAYSYVKAGNGKKEEQWLVFFDGSGKIFSELRTGDATLTLQMLIGQKRVAAAYEFADDRWQETAPALILARLKA